RGDFDLEDFLAARDPQHAPHLHAARGLGALAVHVHLAGLDRLLGQAARAEEARRPEPDVEPDRGRRHQQGRRARMRIAPWVERRDARRPSPGLVRMFMSTVSGPGPDLGTTARTWLPCTRAAGSPHG